MTSRYTFSKNRNTLLVLLACILFYAAQASAQLHSIDHLFHKANDSCALYHSIEHNKSGVIHNHIHVQITRCYSQPLTADYINPVRLFNKAWHSRAPPQKFPV